MCAHENMVSLAYAQIQSMKRRAEMVNVNLSFELCHVNESSMETQIKIKSMVPDIYITDLSQSVENGTETYSYYQSWLCKPLCLIHSKLKAYQLVTHLTSIDLDLAIVGSIFTMYDSEFYLKHGAFLFRDQTMA